MAYAFKRKNIWYIRYKDENDKWEIKSCGKNAIKTDADYLAREYSAKELNRKHKAPVRIVNSNLEQALILYRDTVVPRSTMGIDKQQSSIRREQATVNNFIFFVREKHLEQFKAFDKEMAQAFIDKRVEEGMSAKTRREERRQLRKFFKWAIKQNYCAENPTEEIVAPKLPKRKPRFFSMDELKKIFETAMEPYRLIFMFLYLTGLRTGELCNLEWRDYNRDLRTLTIRVVAADKKKRTPGNKTKREETIPLCDEAINILERREAANDSEQFVFLNQAGNRLDDDNIYRNLMPILDKLKIRDASPHTFRHTFASHLVIAGVSIYVVKELLRHASVQETEIYAHLAKDTTSAAVEKLNGKMQSIVPGNSGSSQAGKQVCPGVFLPFFKRGDVQ
ncbi:MAG TPA: tyrosine-type recombinase/integrase [Chitinivibrionales bacterium]|nr:tyrosine-type recombinase/integrase [Chitinivibrionales bacterium]